MNTKAIIALAIGTALGGCATYGSPEAGKFDDADLGEANRITFSAMVVDPDPQYDTPMEGSGERAAAAYTAYREGSVEEPPSVGSVGGGGGEGGGGGGSGGGSSR